MMKMTPIVKEWYDYLSEGKIMGLRCTKCGHAEFPPTPVCKCCSGMDMEWSEVDREGTLLSMSLSPTGIPGYTQEPTYTAYARMNEGMYYAAPIIGFTKADYDPLIERLKSEVIKVEMVVTKIDETHSFPYFELKN